MGKGIVKGIGGTPTPVKTIITVEYDQTTVTNDSNYNGTNPVGESLMGKITDSQTGLDVDFVQAFGAELGLVDGVKVTYSVITIAGKPVATSVKLIERGIIETINATNDGGTLMDKATRVSMPFSQLYCKELGIVAPSPGVRGSTVTFERILDPKTAKFIAVALDVK
jgi:hypothetical protein